MTTTQSHRVQTMLEQQIDIAWQAAGNKTTLEEAVLFRRASDISWPKIAAEITAVTGLYVSEATLRAWYGVLANG